MLLNKYEYDLPEELIANRPTRPRDSSRLLIVNKKSGRVDLGFFSDLLNFFSSNDLAIFNNTKVLPVLIKGLFAGSSGPPFADDARVLSQLVQSNPCLECDGVAVVKIEERSAWTRTIRNGEIARSVQIETPI